MEYDRPCVGKDTATGQTEALVTARSIAQRENRPEQRVSGEWGQSPEAWQSHELSPTLAGQTLELQQLPNGFPGP